MFIGKSIQLNKIKFQKVSIINKTFRQLKIVRCGSFSTFFVLILLY